jgi:PAS domain S-box-containing protein
MKPIGPIVCSFVLLTGVGLTEAGASNEKPEPVVLQLPYSHQFQFAGYYAAQFKGFFAEEGLAVDIRAGDSKHRPYQELASGHAQYGVGSATYLLDRLNGAPLVLAATVYQHSPLALMVPADSNIRAPEDLRGRRLAAGSGGRYPEMAAMFALEGVQPGDYTLVDDKWEVDEIVTGEADAQLSYITDLPYDMQQRGIAVRLIRPSDYGVDYYGDGLFTTETEVRLHAPRVAAMRRAVLRGWQYALDHSEEVIAWIDRHLPDRPARVTPDRMRFEARQIARLINANVIELGHTNPERWRRIGETYVALGMARDLGRLEGFVFAEQKPEAIPGWVKALLWGLAVALGLTLLAVLANRRLQRLVARRTRELQEAEQQQREIFDYVPVPLVVEDMREVAATLDRLRAAGVTDLRAHLAAHPAIRAGLLEQRRVVAASRRALQVSGFARLAEMQTGLPRIMTQESWDNFTEQLVALWEERDSLVVENSYVLPDGNRIDMLLNWSVNRVDGRRDLSRVRLAFTDITELKRAEQALRENEARYRHLFEQSPLPIVEFDYTALMGWFLELRAQGVNDLAAHVVAHPGFKAEALQRAPVMDVNQAAVQIVGAASKQEFLEKLSDIYTPSVLEQRWQNVLRAWRGEWQAEGEFELRRVDGRPRTMWYRWRFLSEEGGPHPVQRTQVVMVDITDQREAERALRESEARYRELFERAVGGIYRSTPAGQFIAVNPALARMFHFETPEAMIEWSHRHSISSAFYVHPGRRDEFLELVRNSDRVTNFESEVRSRDGATFWVSEDVRVVRGSRGELQYFEGFVSDITARRRLEQEMGRASKLEAVGILAGGIAHDFNNILTVVLGNVTLAEMDTAPDQSVRKMLRDAKRATLRARDLTQQLLTFAKGGDPVRTAVNLPELLEEAAGFALHGAKARGEYRIAPDLWPANADKGQLGQVVQNLVINSVQAMPEGGVVTITARNEELKNTAEHPTLKPGRYVHLTVADRGVGIAAEHLPRIFDPYFTTKQQGSGLGLATVYSILKKHQGHIEVESQLGVGTTFHLWLPAAIRPAPEPVAARPAASARLRARVLFMDDEATIRDMAALFFKRLELDGAVAADGAEAVKKYGEARAAGQPFDLVIMDLTVPGGMGGREALEHLRQIDPRVRAVVSSGYSRDPVLADYRAHGFCGILPKPYGLEQLRHVVSEVLAGREAGVEI